MAEIKIDIINQMKDALIQSLLKDGIVLPVWHDAKNDPPKEECKKFKPGRVYIQVDLLLSDGTRLCTRGTTVRPVPDDILINNHNTRKKDKNTNTIKDIDRNDILFNNYNTKKKETTMKTIKDVDRIVITKNDLNEVLLRAYSGDEIVGKAIAKCSPDDIFDFNIGAKLVVDRLYDGYDMTPKPKRKLYNGKIFVRADMRNFSFLDPDLYTREGKIWEVKDGKIIDFDRATGIIYEDMTDEELTKLLYFTNISFRGFFYKIVDGYFVR